MTRLELFALGEQQVKYEGERVKFNRKEAPVLLIYLAFNQDWISRESLQLLLWPDENPTRAQSKLRTTLHALRAQLPILITDLPGEESDTYIIGDNEKVRLNPAADIWFDANEFDKYFSDCRSHGHPTTETCCLCVDLLDEAVKLYRDSFMKGSSTNKSENFDNWQANKTSKYEHRVSQALTRLTDYYQQNYSLDDRNWEKAIGFALRLYEILPFDDALRRLMLLYHRIGQHSNATRIYDEYKEKLQHEDQFPTEETQDLYKQIRDPNELDAFIRVESGPGADAGKDFRIGIGVRIGRGHNININLFGDKRVSRNHAQILRKEAQYWLIDYSQHGTKINGQEVMKLKEWSVRDGDQVECGRTQMVFYERQPRTDGAATDTWIGHTHVDRAHD